MPIAVRIAGMAHLVILVIILKKELEGLIDGLFIRADQFQRSHVHALRPLGCISHHENRHTIRGALLLDSTRISQAKEASRFKVVAIEDLDWLDDMNLVTVSEFLIGSLTHNRIHMNGVDSFAFRMLVKNAPDRPEHMMHRLTEVFPAMRCDEDKFTVTNPVKLRVGIVFLNGMLHCIDDSVARNIDIVWVFPFSLQMICSELRRSKIILRNNANRLTIEFLRIRAIDVVSAESSLHMSYWDLEVEAGKCGNEGRGGIPMHKYYIWLDFLQHSLDAVKDVCSDVEQRLTVLHDVQVIVRDDTKRLQHLVEHLPVLRRDAYDNIKTFSLLHLVHQRADLNRPWARTENGHDLTFHTLYLFLRFSYS